MDDSQMMDQEEETMVVNFTCPQCSVTRKRTTLLFKEELDINMICLDCAPLCVYCKQSPRIEGTELCIVCDADYQDNKSYEMGPDVSRITAIDASYHAIYFSNDSEDSNGSWKSQEERESNGTVIQVDESDPTNPLIYQTSPLNEGQLDNATDPSTDHPTDPPAVSDHPTSLKIDDAKAHKVCAKIQSISDARIGRLGHDGSSGPINGELGPKGCVEIMKSIPIDENDVILDVGHSGGIAALRMSAISKCKAVIGFESEHQRYVLSTTNQQAVLDSQDSVLKNINMPVTFEYKDIKDIACLNGVTIIYMFDTAFTEDIIQCVLSLAENSSTVNYIISTRNQLKSNILLDIPQQIGTFNARGNAMQRNFYLYKTTHQKESYTTDPFIDSLINRATNLAQRYQHCVDVSHANQEAGRPIRSDNAMRILNEPTDKARSKVLYNKLTKRQEIHGKHYNAGKSKRGITTYTIDTDCSRSYLPREIATKNNVIEFDAYTTTTPYNGDYGVIAPCMCSGNPDEILVSLMHTESGPRYFGVVYSLTFKNLKERPIADVLTMFNHETSESLTSEYMESIYDHLRNAYPLKNQNALNPIVGLTTGRSRLSSEVVTVHDEELEAIDEPKRRSYSKRPKHESVVSNLQKKNELLSTKYSAKVSELQAYQKELKATQKEKENHENEVKRLKASIEEGKNKSKHQRTPKGTTSDTLSICEQPLQAIERQDVRLDKVLEKLADSNAETKDILKLMMDQARQEKLAEQARQDKLVEQMRQDKLAEQTRQDKVLEKLADSNAETKDILKLMLDQARQDKLAEQTRQLAEQARQDKLNLVGSKNMLQVLALMQNKKYKLDYSTYNDSLTHNDSLPTK